MRRLWTELTIAEAIGDWAGAFGEPPAMPDWDPARALRLGDEVRAARARRLLADQQVPSASTVIRRFGTWNAALVAAGFGPRAAHGGDGNELRARRVALEDLVA